ncbi:hypothetical protein [Paenibacillus sp. FSL H8-0537]|uniref:hypothetical protein n=1 Tax=Paenibacillus sp. FSL H8-0537 TaxID=2921399 RepID=UPI0031016097
MKNNIKSRWIAVGLIAIAVIAVLVFFLITYERLPENTHIINQNMMKLKEDNRSVPFTELTPFVWDKAYVLDNPFYNGQAIDEIVGVTTHLDRLETDHRRRIVFVNQGKFVYDYIYDFSAFTYKPFGIIELTPSSTIRVLKGTSKALIIEVKS